MTNILTIEELKNSVLNANVEDEYIQPAITEAQSIYLREILGDSLLNTVLNRINNDTLTGKYLTLVEDYIKPYLMYMVQSLIVVPINYKIRNAGVISQYDNGFSTSQMKDTQYLKDYYDGKAEFYGNRLTEYLRQNASDIKEYRIIASNVTNPTTSQNVTNIFLGGTKRGKCGGVSTSGGGTHDTVDWNDIKNKPDFATVATSGDYNDLENKPEIPSLDGYATEQWVQQQGYSTFSGDYEDLANKPEIPTVNNATLTITQGGATKGTFTANAGADVTIDLEAGGSGSTDWNDIQNKPDFATVATSGSYADLSDKPTIPVVPTNVSAFTNDAGYLTQHQSLAGYATEQWVENRGYSTFNGDYSDLTNKPNLAAVATSGSYNDLTDKPEVPGQVNADWNATSGVAQILNKPTIPTKTSELTNDSGYSTFSGSYNDLTNKPTIPTVNNGTLTIKQGGVAKGTFTANSNENIEINLEAGGSGSTDWNDIQNKPDFAAVATSGSYNDLSNKPTIPTVPTNVSAFTNDAGYLTQHQSLTGYATEQWVQQQGYTTFDGDYNSLQNKPTIPAAQVQADWSETDTTSMAYIKNKPSMPSAQVQADWNETDTSAVDYIKNKPTIPTVPTNVSAFANDAGYLTQHQSLAGYATESWVQQQGYSTFDGDYNSLSNKPTIPAAQVNSDWNATSGVAQILNKPTIPSSETDLGLSSETWTFTLSDGTTVTKTVVIK